MPARACLPEFSFPFFSIYSLFLDSPTQKGQHQSSVWLHLQITPPAVTTPLRTSSWDSPHGSTRPDPTVRKARTVTAQDSWGTLYSQWESGHESGGGVRASGCERCQSAGVSSRCLCASQVGTGFPITCAHKGTAYCIVFVNIHFSELYIWVSTLT